MASFQTKHPNLGKFYRVLQWKMLLYFMTVGSILRPLVYFVAICYILWLFGRYIFPVLVYCTNKNLAALVRSRFTKNPFWNFL
jgi:hypothetical protein